MLFLGPSVFSTKYEAKHIYEARRLCFSGNFYKPHVTNSEYVAIFVFCYVLRTILLIRKHHDAHLHLINKGKIGIQN